VDKSTIHRHASRLVPPLLIAAIVAALGIAWTVSAGSAAPEQYASYHNDRWHFALVAPADMKVEALDYADGGQQLSFANTSGTEIFTVAAVPYAQLDLVLDREGAPTAMSDQPDHLEIVNFTRTDFFKVWFSKNGVLYIVGASTDQEAWLRNILKTWQFDERFRRHDSRRRSRALSNGRGRSESKTRAD
jgi:hypothetical protein